MPALKAILRRLTQANTDEDLVAVLEPLCHDWNYPKADLFHFIPILNRFDGILETITKKHGLYVQPPSQTDVKKASAENVSPALVQAMPFSPAAKQLLTLILRFSQLLQENATNRNIYTSYEVLMFILISWP